MPGGNRDVPEVFLGSDGASAFTIGVNHTKITQYQHYIHSIIPCM